MQPDPECTGGKKPEGPAASSLVQGPDFSAPPTPTFPDKNGCVYKYESPNGDLMQPDPECPLDKEGKPKAKPEGPAEVKKA